MTIINIAIERVLQRQVKVLFQIKLIF